MDDDENNDGAFSLVIPELYHSNYYGKNEFRKLANHIMVKINLILVFFNIFLYLLKN